MLKHYITVAFRNLWKYRLQNIIGITGLSLGFICFSVVVFEIEWRTGYDAGYPGAERIYTLHPKHHSDYIGNIYNLNQTFPEIEKITFKIENWKSSYFTFDSVKAQYYNFRLFECDTAFVDFFSIKLLVGNKYTVNKTTNSIVLFDTKAKQIDKNMKSLIGRTVYLGDEKLQVTGIAQKPVNSFMEYGDGLVINKEGSVFRDEIYSKWNPNNGTSYIMVKNKISIKKFEETLSNRRFNFKLYQDRLGYTVNDDGTLSKDTANEEDERFTIKPLRDALPREMIAHYFERFLFGLLILLVTLFNYTAFQTAQFYSRLKECALRRTAGAGKKDLFFLFFSEIIIAFIFVYIVSILLLNTLGKYIHEQGWFYLPDISILQISMLKYILLVLAIASVLYMIPINIIHRMSIRTVFLGISRKGRKGIARSIMLFFQLGVLLIFLLAFAIVGLQTNKSMNLTLNHLSKEEKMNIVCTYITVADALKNNIDVITNKISSSSFVDGVLVTDEMATNKPGLLVAAKDEELGLPNFYEKWIG
ncbi:MAG: FtsX-like permease family protein, partial [Bacteroidales bacterium]|nr:FtsX-like permease family protein [Bacteroidales bacterium]